MLNLDTLLVELDDNDPTVGIMEGHKFCSTDPWVYGPSIVVPAVAGGSDGGDNPAPFHPTPAGQQAIADRVLTALS